MQVLHKHLLSSRVNTRKPEQAKAFFIPVYLGRFFNAQWQRYSDPNDAWLINKECHGLSPWDCWEEKWQVAINVSVPTLLLLLIWWLTPSRACSSRLAFTGTRRGSMACRAEHSLWLPASGSIACMYGRPTD